MQKWCFIVFLLASFGLHAQQNENVFLHRDYTFKYQAKADTGNAMHSSVKPYLKKNVKEIKSLSEGVQPTQNLNVLPIIDFISGYDLSSNNYVGFEGAGANIFYEPHEKVGFNLQYKYVQTGGLSFVDDYADSLMVIDGLGRSFKRNNRHFGNQLTGYVSYSPNQIFNLQLGRGEHFWGDGYRSFLLSDNASPMPYFRIMTDVWRIKYVNLYAMQTDIRNLYKFNKKYTATHYLDWSITPKLNLGLFETVVWLQQDTLINRGLELNYLNPIIFYRPVEYAQGSADNVLMGMNFKVKLSKKTTLYTQLVIDEFKIDELRSDSGWWANKYAIQLGVKSYDLGEVKGLFAQVEFNMARPFMYSHSNSFGAMAPINTIQNYGHANQSMAHPLGGNFYEYLGVVRYQKEKWLVENKLNYFLYGADSTGLSLGQDLYKSYDLREKSYNNYMLQGVINEVVQNELRLSYQLSEQYNLWASLAWLYRYHNDGRSLNRASFVSVSLRTAISNRYYDY